MHSGIREGWHLQSPLSLTAEYLNSMSCQTAADTPPSGHQTSARPSSPISQNDCCPSGSVVLPVSPPHIPPSLCLSLFHKFGSSLALCLTFTVTQCLCLFNTEVVKSNCLVDQKSDQLVAWPHLALKSVKHVEHVNSCLATGRFDCT